MATSQHPITSPRTPVSALRPTTAWQAPARRQSLDDAAVRAGADVDSALAVEPAADAEPGPTSTALLTLGGGGWALIVVLAALALIVPFLAGLLVVGLAGAVSIPPYLLVHHLRNRR